MIQENLPDMVEPVRDEANPPQPFLYHYSLSEIHNKGKADIQGVVGAAMNGDIQLLEMALYPPSRADPNSTAYFDYIPTEPITSHQQLETQRLLERAQFFAKNWAVYSRLASLLPEPSASLRRGLIRRFAEYGNLDIVRNLLDNGCHVDGEIVVRRTGHRGTPLYLASRYGNADVVNLLLERGADVERTGLNNFRPLLGAIKSGNIYIVQKLLEYGAKCYFYDIVEALLSEYENMIDLLLGQYTKECLYVGMGSELAKEMSRYGLSSMLTLLLDRGYFRYVDGKIMATVDQEEGKESCDLCGYLHTESEV
ncbi:unnamed protein product [Clonostachys rhizophaga]|uniref:Uncharacterized protein n=1 Tax=Clonostachys rhizophaga TaxID=160324 RepID=A0A9N9YHJ7_9HYPO|nr:unnamed protein product [Clonostachys rhizophaga]